MFSIKETEGRRNVKIPNIRSDILIPVKTEAWFSGSDNLVVVAKH
jgi:hypothetical protein